ncbi:AAA family ATPase [Candidatus Woesearchaeota archaeon]|nr:AAA family ATPase [Candidatus Woesearchaeota archaeon]
MKKIKKGKQTKTKKTTITIVTGTPGTGKTTTAKKIAEKQRAVYIDVNDVIKHNKLKEGYDKKRKAAIIDIKKLSKVLVQIIKEARKKGISLIIDSHLAHYVSPKHVDICVVTKTSLKKLQVRLKKRGYHKAKIQENLECEIFDVCFEEAKEMGHKIKIITT